MKLGVIPPLWVQLHGSNAKRARLGAKPGSHQSTPSRLVAGAGGARAAGLLPYPATVKRQRATSRLVPNLDIIFSPG